jgi:hypothetical protein
MKRKFHAGITSVSLPVFVQDTSSSTGAGLAVTAATANLVAEYRRHGQSSWTAITLDGTKTLGTWKTGGLIADGSLTGAYEFDPPDAAVAGGARWVAIRLSGAANMLPVLIEIELDVVDYQDGSLGMLDLAAGVETNRTLRQALRLMLATLVGKLSGAAGTTVSVRDTNDSKDRVVATVDSSGNRSTVTLDAS